jgi:hypothetical protein
MITFTTLCAEDETLRVSCTSAKCTKLAIAQRRGNIVIGARDDVNANGLVEIVVSEWSVFCLSLKTFCDLEHIWFERQLRLVASLMCTATRTSVFVIVLHLIHLLLRQTNAMWMEPFFADFT